MDQEKSLTEFLKIAGFGLLLLYANLLSANVEVHIEGVVGKLEESLLTGLSIQRQKDNEKLTAASIRALYRRSTDEIKTVLRSHGYYQSQLKQTMRRQQDTWLVNFTIDPGPPIIVRRATIQITGGGNNDPVLLDAVNTFPLKEGDQLNHGLYESGKKLIQNQASQRGYFDGSWLTHRLDVNTNEKTADINLLFNSGVRYRFDAVPLPSTVILPELLEKFLTINSGQQYDAAELIRTQENLQNTGYFSQVVISADTPDEDGKLVPVNIDLVEKKKNAYRVGLGFATDTGPRLAASWDNRYLNRRGHRLENDARFSLVQSSLSSSYLIPFFRGMKNELGITAAISREDTDTSVNNKFQSGIQHLSSRWGWNETASLTYQFEDFKVAGTSSTSNLLLPGISYWKSVSDNAVYTSRGFRLSADLRGSVDGLVSNVSFLQLTLRGKFIFPIAENGRLISRAQVGATLSSSFTGLPSSFRFFAGGDNSIRGFDLEALGPRNAQGDVVGGKYLAVGSIEYEHRVYKKWSVALFSDFGNAFDDFSGGLEYSVGAGIHWQSPVGSIRVDVATGISQSDHPVRLHIIIGPDL